MWVCVRRRVVCVGTAPCAPSHSPPKPPKGSASGTERQVWDRLVMAPVKSTLCVCFPPAANFYQLPVQIPVVSVQRVNTAAAASNDSSSRNFTLTAAIISVLQPQFLPTVAASCAPCAVSKNNQSHDDCRNGIDTLQPLTGRRGIPAFILLC